MNTKTPLKKRGFLLSCSAKQKQKGREIPALCFILPVAEATATERSRMPSGRAVVHRTTAAIRPAVPTRSAAASHRNGGGVGWHRLVERRHRHGLGYRHRRKAEADREQGHNGNLHDIPSYWHATLLARDENDFAQTSSHVLVLDHLTDDGASDGDASDDGANGDGASGGDASDGDANAPARASSDRLRSARRPPAQR
jgi:hypothetical protein